MCYVCCFNDRSSRVIDVFFSNASPMALAPSSLILLPKACLMCAFILGCGVIFCLCNSNDEFSECCVCAELLFDKLSTISPNVIACSLCYLFEYEKKVLVPLRLSFVVLLSLLSLLMASTAFTIFSFFFMKMPVSVRMYLTMSLPQFKNSCFSSPPTAQNHSLCVRTRA